MTLRTSHEKPVYVRLRETIADAILSGKFRDGDPLPYSALPSDANGLPYGSDIGGCRTYGDITYIGNSWFQAPMETEMQLANDLYEGISPGTPPPYSSQGFFDICPYTAAGTSYPTNLSFSGNSDYTPAYTPKAK